MGDNVSRVVRLRKILGVLELFCGSVLILLSFLSGAIWNENSVEYLNLKEGGLVYGLLIIFLGLVLMYFKRLSILQYLWCIWAGLMFVQLLRVYPDQKMFSQIMNSVKMFWIVLILGMLLIGISIWHKCRSIF